MPVGNTQERKTRDSHKILVVEDSPAMRSLISSILERLPGCEVVEAASGFAALQLLPREQVDLLITDINMTDINGLELLGFVRRNPNFSGIPVIIVSTESSERDREKGLKLGANAYVAKPFQADELLDVVRRLLKLPAV